MDKLVILIGVLTLGIAALLSNQINYKQLPAKNLAVTKNVVNLATSKIESTPSAVEDTPSPDPTKVAVASPVPLQLPVQSGNQLNVPILLYHYISLNPNPNDHSRDSLSVAPDIFDAQMGYLSKAGFTPISLDSLYAALTNKATLPAKPIILTFDDGYIDFYFDAYPILKKYNFSATVFIPTGLVGGSYYLTWPQIKEMDASGLISFEAHSVNHYSLVSLSNDQLKYQVVESKKVLQDQLGKPVNFFAYPYGTSNSRVWQEVKNAGFVGGIGTWHGVTISQGTLFDMPRIRISGAWDTNQFASNI